MSPVRRIQIGLVLAVLAVGGMFTFAMTTTAQAASIPTITSIAPGQGTALGGTAVTIRGTDFMVGVMVYIGGFPASSVVRVDDTTITLSTPAAPGMVAGAANVQILNPDGGSVTLNSGFFYSAYENPLSITSVAPDRGPNQGGGTATIVGTGFSAAATVLFGDVPSGGVNVPGSSSILAKIPANVAGTVPVTIINPDGTKTTLAKGYTYDGGVTVNTVSPAGGPLAGGGQITIAGYGFVRGATVTIGTAAATNVVNATPTAITNKVSVGVIRRAAEPANTSTSNTTQIAAARYISGSAGRILCRVMVDCMARLRPATWWRRSVRPDGGSTAA